MYVFPLPRWFLKIVLEIARTLCDICFLKLAGHQSTNILSTYHIWCIMPTCWGCAKRGAHFCIQECDNLVVRSGSMVLCHCHSFKTSYLILNIFAHYIKKIREILLTISAVNINCFLFLLFLTISFHLSCPCPLPVDLSLGVDLPVYVGSPVRWCGQ